MIRTISSLVTLVICSTLALHATEPTTIKDTVSLTIPSIEQISIASADTIDTSDPDIKIILSRNNTWKYYNPALEAKYATAEVFNENWTTNAVFSYREIEIKDLPDIIELNLVENLSDFTAPISGRVSSKYGPRGRRNHNGIDIPLKTGKPLYSMFDGKIRYAQYNRGGFGNLVIVRHPNGLETWMAHLSRIDCAVGDFVKSGQVVGLGGNTGRSRGAHLHLEIRYKDQTFDPEFLIDFATGELKYKTFALEKKYFNIHSRASELLHDDEYDDVLPESVLASSNDEILKTAEKMLTPEPIYYVVRRGDVLGKIASKYGTSISNICKQNKLRSAAKIYPGQRLKIR